MHVNESRERCVESTETTGRFRLSLKRLWVVGSLLGLSDGGWVKRGQSVCGQFGSELSVVGDWFFSVQRSTVGEGTAG